MSCRRKAVNVWVVMVCAVLGWPGVVWGQYGGGSGTDGDPYMISDPNHMQAIGEHEKHGRREDEPGNRISRYLFSRTYRAILERIYRLNPVPIIENPWDNSVRLDILPWNVAGGCGKDQGV